MADYYSGFPKTELIRQIHAKQKDMDRGMTENNQLRMRLSASEATIRQLEYKISALREAVKKVLEAT